MKHLDMSKGGGGGVATDLGPTPKNSSKLFYKPAANIFKELQILSNHVEEFLSALCVKLSI